MRRLRVRYEAERLITVDEAKMEAFQRENQLATVARTENKLRSDIVSSASMSLAELPHVVGEGGAETDWEDLDIELEEECEKHPGSWYSLHPGRMAVCAKCREEKCGANSG